ncbi:MAG: 50S ribosomal protein L5 [Candidatus Komeilibacteria bacterium]|nr:50S ribosomal protein L5 [Candidatus Komeilibacteria bacterium]
MKNLLYHKYLKEVIPALQKELGRKNVLSLPRLSKVVINVGIGKSKEDAKMAEVAESTIQRITGQKPVFTLAKKSISAFKVREGMKVGLKVTLRGERMWDFLEKLINVALPRVRDFRGLNPKKGFDKQGNFSVGFKEHLVFPEIKSDEVEKIHGLEVAVAMSTTKPEENRLLLSLLGFPFLK